MWISLTHHCTRASIKHSLMNLRVALDFTYCCTTTHCSEGFVEISAVSISKIQRKHSAEEWDVDMLNILKNVTFQTLALFYRHHQKVYPNMSSLTKCPLAQNKTIWSLTAGRAQKCWERSQYIATKVVFLHSCSHPGIGSMMFNIVCCNFANCIYLPHGSDHRQYKTKSVYNMQLLEINPDS